MAGHAPVQRYETKPGEQLQFDWGEFVYEDAGVQRKFYGFTAVLGYSRMRFVTFVKRCDTPTLIRCLMEAFEYFGGPDQNGADRSDEERAARNGGQQTTMELTLCGFHGLDWSRGTGLQGIYAPNEGKSGADGEPCQKDAVGRDQPYRSR